MLLACDQNRSRSICARGPHVAWQLAVGFDSAGDCPAREDGRRQKSDATTAAAWTGYLLT